MASILPLGERSRVSGLAGFNVFGPAFRIVPMNKENKVNSRIMKYTAALAAAGLLVVAGVRGQSPAASSAATPGKVGVINIRGAIGNTAEGKQASAELQSQFASRQTELENLNKQINDLRQRLAACEGKCSQDEIGRLTQQGQKSTQRFDRLNNELNEDVQSAQGEVIDRIGRKMVDVLDRYSRENGFTLVLDSSAQNTPILFASTQIDVTQDIVRLYDQAYPVKAGAAPAQQKPAAAKPAPTTPTTTPTKP
jgi:outer membrane protein